MTRKPAGDDDADRLDGHDPGTVIDDLLSGTVGNEDPGAVRVRLAPSSALGGEPVLRVGLAGGGGVSAQRQPVVDGEPRDVVLDPVGHERHLLRDAGRHTTVILGAPTATQEGTVREVLVDGFRFEVEAASDRRATLRERATRASGAAASTAPLDVRAIIPGKVVALSIAVGDTVAAGQQLLVVEAMKMQNELRAPRDGTITRIGVGPGVNIDVGDLLVVIS
jgi:biotin carboxyl carrier protein